MRILLLHGPNLDLLGKRQPEIYGHETLQDIENKVRGHAFGRAEIECYQSNHEGELIEAIHRARQGCDAVIINAGAYTHTSVAILDALNAFDGKVVEVHLSNVHRREEFRHRSYIAGRADGIIIGLGSYGYLAAVDFLTQ
ncbi:type II 3-dehydroquinate dehydratase [Halotalea alkalilenta]|uniref:type II 3-dehydroquinate dehydratase n=1 Tax=Halotalea alkalilenta TaxID=376489 RepID=UPI000488003C|nr:type II 3-dehydroquinate dehydratase [Halotalea alkalilenta]